MLPLRWVAGGVLFALLAGCAAEGADDDEVVGSDDAALAALEAEIGFDGAVERLDEAALEAIDKDARVLEARGEATSSIDSLTTKKALYAALYLTRAPKKAGLAPKALRTLDVYDSDLFKLNELEQGLCKKHRIVCVRVALAALKARSASQAAYRDGNVGGRIDAFRHTYWNAAMTRSVGDGHAKAWADAHEDGYPQNRATPKDRVLSDMDFFNNDVGRKLGRAHADDSDGETKEAVREAITKGDVRAVRYDLGDRDGTLVPSSQCTATVKCGT